MDGNMNQQALANPKLINPIPASGKTGATHLVELEDVVDGVVAAAVGRSLGS